MKHESGVFEHADSDDAAAEIAQARADAAAGRRHDHAVVSEWIRTWGMPDRRPFREWLAERDG